MKKIPGNLLKTLEKSWNFISLEKWEPCTLLRHKFISPLMKNLPALSTVLCLHGGMICIQCYGNNVNNDVYDRQFDYFQWSVRYLIFLLDMGNGQLASMHWNYDQFGFRAVLDFSWIPNETFWKHSLRLSQPRALGCGTQLGGVHLLARLCR